MSVVSRILDPHAEQAALAWLRRDRAATQPHFRLKNLFKLDCRLDAHLDGARIARAGAANAAWDVSPYFKQSNGDEAGAAKKGVLTSVNKGKVYWSVFAARATKDCSLLDRRA